MRVCLVVAVRSYRDGVAAALGRRGDLQIVGAFADEQEAVMALGELCPDVVAVDVARGGGPGAIRALLAACPDVRAVALGVPDAEADIVACLEAGALGYVTVGQPIDALAEAVLTAARGEVLCSPRVAAVLQRRLAALARTDRADDVAPPRLTRREEQIARLVADGLSNKQIAQRLHIELPTVKNHVHRVLQKLGVHRRTEAAALMRRVEPVVFASRGVRRN